MRDQAAIVSHRDQGRNFLTFPFISARFGRFGGFGRFGRFGRFGSFARFGGFVSAVSFRPFRFVVSGFSTCRLFYLILHVRSDVLMFHS